MTMNHFPIICFDFDDTINNLLSHWLNYLNEKHFLNVSELDIKSWEMKKAFPTLTEEEIFEPLNNPNFWKTVTEKPDAGYWLQKLQNEGFIIYICTSTHHNIAGFKFENCLFKLFPFIDRHNIIITYNKQLINCDILVDDATHNIEGRYFGLLMDMPHNRTYEVDNHKTYRVYNMKEVYDKIHELCDPDKEDLYEI